MKPRPRVFRFVAGLVVTLVACHESDHRGGALPFRVDADLDRVPVVAGDSLMLNLRVVDGMMASARRPREVVLSVIGPGGLQDDSQATAPRTLMVPAGQSMTAEVVLRRAGRYRIAASAASSTRWLSPFFDIQPSAPHGLRYVSAPRDAWSEDPQRITVEVIDRFGNRCVEDGGRLVKLLPSGSEALVEAGVATFDGVAFLEGQHDVLASSLELASTSTRSVTVGAGVVGGRVTFEHVPLKFNERFGAAALDYENTVVRQGRGLRVQLLDDTEVLAESWTASDGTYRLAVPYDRPAGAMLQVAVLAHSRDPWIRVADNVAAGRLYALESPPFLPNPEGPSVIDLRAASGWEGDGYGARASAPFSLLDTIGSAARALVPQWLSSLPLLTVYWSEDNRPEAGSLADGAIGTSHYRGDQRALYILGAEDLDTDEFDVAVVVHEWGHFLFHHGFGRSDTVGGRHAVGDVLDARTAYEEGACNALAAIAGLASDGIYADTSGVRQSDGWLERIDDNLGNDPLPGWFSEQSVQAIVFDMVDSTGDEFEGHDALAFPASDVVKALSDAIDGDGYATAFSMIGAFKKRFPAAALDIDALAAHHHIAPENDGGWSENIPLYRPVPIGGGNQSLVLLGPGDEPPDEWAAQASANRWVSFMGDGRTWQVTVASDDDVDLYLSEDGWPLLQTRAATGHETLFVTTRPDATYIANVRAWAEGASVIEASLFAAPLVSPKKAPHPMVRRRLDASRMAHRGGRKPARVFKRGLRVFVSAESSDATSTESTKGP